MNLKNMRMIANAASMSGPAGTTAYMIAPNRLEEMRRDLDELAKNPEPCWLAFASLLPGYTKETAPELAGLLADSLHELDANDELDDDYRASVQKAAQIFSNLAGEKKAYTVFCVDDSDESSTTHIATHEARTVHEASRLARAECADDWGRKNTDNIRVLGVAAVVNGAIEILEWDYSK